MNIENTADSVWKAFYSRDPDEIRNVLTDDIEWIAPKDNVTAIAPGVTDHMIGKEAIVNFLIHDLPKLFYRGIKITVLSITTEASRVIYEQIQTAHLSNGRYYENTYVFILEMNGKQVYRTREYMDTYKGYRMVFADDTPGCIVKK